jgi:hypothetical protein
MSHGLCILTLDQSVARTEIIATMNLGVKTFSTKRSNCLSFEMFGVEAHAFLPNRKMVEAILDASVRPKLF